MDAREVAKHASASSCWVVIHDNVYDVTDYLGEHPGGQALLLKLAGADATSEYTKVHSTTTVQETLPHSKHLGPLDDSTRQHLRCITKPKPKATTKTASSNMSGPPPLALCVRLADFEPIARAAISRQAYTYISSAADTLQSHHDNLAQWASVSFVPRVLRNVALANMDTSTSMLGQPCALPFFIAATGLAGLTHPEGERALAAAAASRGIHYSPSTYSSIPHKEVAELHRAAQKQSCLPSTLFFQLYVHHDRAKTVQLIRDARAAGYAGLFVTVDTPCVGNRDEDRRLKAEDQLAFGPPPAKTTKVVAGSNSGQLARNMTWDDLPWIRNAWGHDHGRPLALKGIQSAADAKLAADSGLVDAIYLSNHGGRQLHSAPPCLATLLRIRRECPDVLDKCEVFVDGGCLRGGDILKAVCLGAKAVGIGRPLLYALGAYGMAGVVHAIDILKNELETTLALLGVTSPAQLNSSYINVAKLARDIDGLDGIFGNSKL
ncbi:hypothetical protein SBRCBS47491_002450 [Sporothrix bragantina]|uniref:L-lactate dehydrogenase (Cytochrome) n=1 Tax=Sporothrix bragantina TaxID=671064 RepID=A0ABP0B779_9PEZI